MNRIVGDLLAVDFRKLKLPISDQEALDMLKAKGIYEENINVIELARSCLGREYERGACPQKAPHIFDCSSFTKWLYGQRGIWLPRHSIDQRAIGSKAHIAHCGDLIFTSGHRSYFWDNPNDDVGHVGIVTGVGTVIHAANTRRGVVEDNIQNFFNEKKFRGIRRYIPKNAKVYTLFIPEHLFIETPSAIRWKILQLL